MVVNYTSKLLNLVLGLLDELETPEQRSIAVIPETHLPLFSEVLDSFDTILALYPEDAGLTILPGRWRRIKLPVGSFEEPIIQLPDHILERYGEVARSIVSYVSPAITRSVMIVSGTRDHTAVTAYEVLKLMEGLRMSSHVHLILDADLSSVDDVDKINIASIVGRLMAFNHFSIIPFSIDRVLGYSTKLGQVDYVGKCLAELLTRFFRNPVTGTYIPICLSFEPASMFRDVVSAVDLAFYAYTRLHRVPIGNILFGTVRMWKGMKERLGALGEAAGDRLALEYLEDDRIEVKIMIRYGMLGVLNEGMEILRRIADSKDAITIAARLSRLQDRTISV